MFDVPDIPNIYPDRATSSMQDDDHKISTKIDAFDKLPHLGGAWALWDAQVVWRSSTGSPTTSAHTGSGPVFRSARLPFSWEHPRARRSPTTNGSSASRL